MNTFMKVLRVSLRQTLILSLQELTESEFLVISQVFPQGLQESPQGLQESPHTCVQVVLQVVEQHRA